MNFKQLRTTSKVKYLAFLEPTIIHAVPEFGQTVADMINSSGIRMNNCWGVISKSKPQKLGTRVFNSRKIYLDAKSKLSSRDSDSTQVDRMLKVMQTLPPQQMKSIKDQKKFIVIDHTIISQAALHMLQLTNTKNAVFFMLQQLKKEFLAYKTKNADIQNNIIFLFGNEKPKESMFDLLYRLLMLQDLVTDSLKSFDKYILASVNINNSPIIFPIADYDRNGDPRVYRKHITLIDDIYSKVKPQTDDEIDKDQVSPDSDLEQDPVSKRFQNIRPSTHAQQIIDNIKSKKITTTTSSIPDSEKDIRPSSITRVSQNPASKIAKDINQDKNIVDKNIHITDDNKITSSADINQKQLSRILRKHKIQDKTIEHNIRKALDAYLATNPKNVTSENLERIILLAINKSIFNKDEIDDEYLEHPAKLFSKLQEVNTYSKNISYPKEKIPSAMSASDVVGLKRVTGLVRHEHEFSDIIHKNIKTVFQSLETKFDAPIKVKKVDFKYQDNNLNRVINYDITLQNTTGENSEPYKVNIKVPALVNDRYFKLNGKDYIMANQQFFKTITKTDPNEVRLLTSYSTITLSVVNMKLNISEIDKLIEYININYPELIVKIDKDGKQITKIVLKDKLNKEHVFDIYGNEPYSSDDEKIYLDEDTGKWILKKEDSEIQISTGKSEYIYDRLLKLIQEVDPNESLKKGAKSIPYIQSHVSKIKLPLIILLWQQIGLINALKKFGIEFNISAENVQESATSIKLKDGKNLYLYPKSERDKLFINGLLFIDPKKHQFAETDLASPNSIDSYIQSKNGTRSTYLLNLQFANIIDPITKELLEYDEMSTDVVDLLSNNMVTKLLNDKADKLTDLKIYRSRQAEVIFNLLYKEIMSAHSKYAKDKQFNKDAKLFLKPDYIIECLLGVHEHSKGSSTLEQTQPFNPVAELKVASKLIKTGPGGVPTKRSFKKEHRSIHPSYHGNIGACSTTEYADVG